MPIHAPHETLHALGNGLLPKCDSPSLFQSRFADPSSEKDDRKAWFNALIKKSAEKIERTDWLPISAVSLHVRLMSRLMVDLASSVMENAHVRLDRYGLPLIPGSAVKGCARRMALQALHDWIEAQNEKGSKERPAADDACAPCCEGFQTPIEMLAAIARVFGWTPDDWKTDKNRDKKTGEETTYKSDFAWATDGNKDLLSVAKALNPNHETFAGTIAFLAASPSSDPGLELDVLTPHHTEYYKGNNPGAPDTEDPVPVYFPAVKAQSAKQYFNFPLIPLVRARDGDLESAKTYLSLGLELLGLGAKTHSGYGWFEILTPQAVPENTGDYPNKESFTNSVIKLLNQPGQYDKLKQEVEKLKKSDNSKWLEKLKIGLRGDDMKKTRKNLREKDWFPKEWLEKPTQ